MESLVALDRRTPAMRWREVHDESSLWGDLRPELADAVSVILHATMEDELAALLTAKPYERTRDRSGYRNGRFRRWLATEIGAIELSVPRARQVTYHPSFLERAARRTSTVDGLLRTAFLRGLSTRETAALAERLTGVALSAATISRLTAQLDGQVAAFHRRRIRMPVRYLLLDGLWVSVRASNGHAYRRVVLAAYGISDDGTRELLDYRQALGESTTAWGALLRSLIERGLDPGGVLLVVADGAGGIAAAVAEAFPDAAFGRCWTHRVRNLLDAIPFGQRKSALRALRAIYRAATKRAAVAAYWRFAKTWRGRHPRLVAGLERDLDSLLVVFDLPASIRVSLRNTNLIERAFRELRRRLRPIGALSDRRSADRILYGQVTRLNELLARRPLVGFTQES
jgi:transposase-like protein